MIKTVLTRPNYHSHLITPPLSLGYLSAYLRNNGYQTEIVDGLNLGYSSDEIVERCKGADLVGITCLSDYFPETVELSKRLKCKGIKVVVGGPHATALPCLTLKQTGADYIVVGEGELTLLELVRSLDKGKTEPIPGILFHGEKKFAKRDLTEDLDSLPFPDWEGMNPARYKKAPHGGLIREFPVAPIVSTRGCPYNCKFCSSPRLWDRRVRYRSAKNVVDEIEYLANKFGVREIHFEDDNLTLNRSHIEQICNFLIGRKIKVGWAAPNGIRADTIDSDLMGLMKKSGCYYLAFGIESSNQQILDNVNKNIDLRKIKEVVTLASRTGLLTQGFFIFGLPGETEETIGQTIDFAKGMPLDRAQFLLLDVLPGSELWDEYEDELTADRSRRSYQEVCWVPKTVKLEVLKGAPARAFRSFFFRPKPLLSLLRFFRISQLRFIWRRLVDFGILPVPILKNKRKAKSLDEDFTNKPSS